MQGKNLCGLTLEWDYKDRYVNISMAGYIAKMLKMLQHTIPAKSQYAPHKWLKPVFGEKSSMRHRWMIPNNLTEKKLSGYNLFVDLSSILPRQWIQLF